jgi:hypothetical protein
MKPVHWLRMSSAGTPGIPSLALRKQPSPGNMWSGESDA